MTRPLTWIAAALAAIALPAGASAPKKAAKPTPAPPGTREETISIPNFGKVNVYRPEPLSKARGVILFVSGDGGWNLGVVDMARRVSDRAIVVGLSMPAWQKRVETAPGRCWYPAGELEVAAQAVEKTYRLPRYAAPILVGYSSGATVVYGALAQAPPTTFAGAVSLGFCPDLEVRRPFCGKDTWKPSYDPQKHRSDLPERPSLAARDDGHPRWIALQGDIDQVCDPKGTVDFVGRIPAARIVYLEKVGHGFSVPRRWGTPFDEAIASLLEAEPLTDPLPESERKAGLADSPEEIRGRLEGLGLPLKTFWPEGAQDVIVFVSGDGGWADLDQKVASALASRGIAVVGWNTLRYFWNEKSPETFRADLARLLMALPERLRVFAGGYSFGAEVVPIVVALGRGHDDPAIRRVAGLVLLGPGPFATFEVSPLDWILTSTTPTDHPVATAIRDAKGLPVLCVTAADDEESGCPDAGAPGVVNDKVPGGHHFGGDYDHLAGEILKFMARG